MYSSSSSVPCTKNELSLTLLLSQAVLVDLERNVYTSFRMPSDSMADPVATERPLEVRIRFFKSLLHFGSTSYRFVEEEKYFCLCVYFMN